MSKTKAFTVLTSSSENFTVLLRVTYVSEWIDGFIIKNNIKFNPITGVVYCFNTPNENNRILSESRNYIILENGKEIPIEYSNIIGNYKVIT